MIRINAITSPIKLVASNFFVDYGPMKPQEGQVYLILCSLQLPHLPITVSQFGQMNVVEPVSKRPFPQEIQRSACFIWSAE
jgi:hypothetical protein